MNLLITIALMLISAIKTSNLHEARELYRQATITELACDKMLKQLEPYTEKNNPTLAAYKASAIIFKAKYTYNPYSKLNYFNTGKALLEKAINENYNNLEIRFLRFNIQSHAPSIAGYSKQIEEDKKMVLDNYYKIIDVDLRALIYKSMYNSTYLNNSEKQKLQN